jgi:sortase A
VNTKRSAPRSTKLLRYLEVAGWTLGAFLLTTYIGSRWWYAQARDEAVAAFAHTKETVEPAPANPPEVDMSTWSPARVGRYRDAARASDVPPAVLRIPALKLVVPVFEGTSDENLNRGAGRIEGTAMLGESGNMGIAAHRDGFFRVLKDVQVGNMLHLERRGAIDTYRVISKTIVDPSDVSVLAPTATDSVTLVTCYPFYFVGSAPQRFIVRAERIDLKKRLPPEAQQASSSASL